MVTPSVRILMCLCLLCAAASAGAGPRAREAGVPFLGETGTWNAITDVPGVEVGQTTLVSGDGAMKLGTGPVRTGVTAIFPKGRAFPGFVYAGTFVANGTGEMTGRALVDEIGGFTGPIVLTGTGSVGTARDAVMAWYAKKTGGDPEETFAYSLPVVAETFDGYLNDTFGGHVHAADVHATLDRASTGPVDEGSVGGGTGMIAHGYKAGIGTASRRIQLAGKSYTVGVLVQANYGSREQLTIAGVPVGQELAQAAAQQKAKEGSLIVVIGTDAPLLPHELRRVALRATHGMARVGGMSGTTSGDLFIAFSTAGPPADGAPVHTVSYVDDLAINPVFTGAVLATEEAIVNSLYASGPMTGINGHHVDGLPVATVTDILKRHGRLTPH
jgi:D-aminopeptidase